MNDALNMRGDFHLRVIHKDGTLLAEYHEKNLIVTAGKNTLAKMLNGNVSNRHITNIGFGTGSTPASSGDTALTNSYSKAIDSASYPDSTSVLFQWSLATGEANGKAITEFGLLSSNGDLFSRRVRDVINKTSDIRLEGTWKIQF